MTPAQRAAVYRRRRLGVATVALLLVVGIGWVIGAVSADDPVVTGTSSTTTTPPSSAVGSCAPPSDRRELVAGLLMIGVDPEDPVGAAAVLRATPGLGGVFVGGNSGAVLGNADFRRTTVDLGLLVAIDDEGGRVQRLDYLAGSLPSARTQARTRTSEEIAELAVERARVMRSLGVNVDLAPVVDVTTQADGDLIGDRSYGDDAESVVAGAGAFASGLRRGGVLPVLKHFPGHGRASGDSHDGAVLTPRLADLQEVDLMPFRRLLAADPVGVMFGHLDVPDLTESGRPASLSPAAFRLLRDDLGFDGVAMTDDLGGMQSIRQRFGLEEAGEVAVAAGADLVLYSGLQEPTTVIDRLVDALEAGRVTRTRVEEAWQRVVRAKVAVGAVDCGV